MTRRANFPAGVVISAFITAIMPDASPIEWHEAQQNLDGYLDVIERISARMEHEQLTKMTRGVNNSSGEAALLSERLVLAEEMAAVSSGEALNEEKLLQKLELIKASKPDQVFFPDGWIRENARRGKVMIIANAAYSSVCRFV